MKSLSLLLTWCFLASSVLHAADAAVPGDAVITGEDVAIERERPKFNDQITLNPSKIGLEKPERDAELGETLSRLPMLVVSSQSGLGSLTSTITATGISSATTAVSIDGVPIMDPVGVGFDFSLIPNALVDGVEYWLPHHQALAPETQTLTSTSGRINVRTKSGCSGACAGGGAANVMLGTASSALGSAAYSSPRFSAAATGFNTDGDYSYKNGLTGAQETRANNSAAGGGALLSWNHATSATGQARIFGLGSLKDRVDPGSIFAPSRDQEKDTFGLVGASIREKEFLSPTWGAHALVSGSLSKVAVRTSPPQPPATGSDRFETRAFGGFAQTGLEKRFDVAEVALDVDDHVDYVRADDGRRNRNINGFGLAAPLHVTRALTVAPWVRQEVSDRMPPAQDAILAASYAFTPQSTLTLSYGWLHAYPTITQIAGEHTPFGDILPNDSLKLERDSVWTLALMDEVGPLQFYSLWQYSRARSLIGFTTLPTGQSQYVNQADAFIASATNDVQYSPLSFLGLRAGVTVLRSFDFAQRRDLPFKPRVTGLGSINFTFGPCLLTAEESFWGRRYTEVSGVDALSPLSQTSLRLAYTRNTYEIAFKAANILDAGGFDYPGFPVPGRAYWLNLSWNGI